MEDVEVWAKELNIVGTRIGGRFERFVAAENFDGNILKELRKCFPDLDIVRV